MSAEELQSLEQDPTTSAEGTETSEANNSVSKSRSCLKWALTGLGGVAIFVGGHFIEAQADEVNPALAKAQGAVYTPYENTPTALERLQSEGYKEPIVVRNK